jgi:ribonuclease P protein component
LKRRFRLTKSTDFKRVRRSGKSYAHPLIVLIAVRNDLEVSRFAVAAGRAVGKAVDRNRAKRQIREALRPMMPTISPGWDVILLARRPIAEAGFPHIQQALGTLIARAHLQNESHGN